MSCLCGKATDSIWRLLASSDGISSWTPLKPQHSNPNPNPLANQLWCIDVYWLPYSSHNSHHPSQTSSLSWNSHATQKLMLDSCKMLQKHIEVFRSFLYYFFPNLKQNFIAYCSSKVFSGTDIIFENHQPWQSRFSRVYSNSWCSCSL